MSGTPSNSEATTGFLLWTGDADDQPENYDADECPCWSPIITAHNLDIQSIHINGIIQPFLIIVAVIRSGDYTLEEVQRIYSEYLYHCRKFRIFVVPKSCDDFVWPYIIGTASFLDNEGQRWQFDRLVADYTESYLEFYTERNILNSDLNNHFDGSARFWDRRSDASLGDAQVVPRRRRNPQLPSNQLPVAGGQPQN